MPPGTRNYSRYVNGNPVTGTEGSIPPNTAFDEVQIEVCEVIQRAGIVPTHNDLTQLWQALEALFAQKYITTAITKTVHGAGADFPDLNAALMWLAQYIITATGSVTFMVASGKWTYTTTVELNHQNANRVFIQGGALLGGMPTRANMSVTGYKTAADGTAQITYLRSVFATELSFSAGITGFRIRSGGCTLRYLLITGSQTVASGYRQGVGIDVFAALWIDGIAIWGFGQYGMAINSSSVYSETSMSFTVSYCNIGVEFRTGFFQMGPFATYPDQITTETLITSCGIGIDAYAGGGFLGKLTLKGCSAPSGTGALNCETGSQMITAHGSLISINAPNGVNVVAGSCLIFEYSQITSNQQDGVIAQGGIAYVDYSACSGNGSTDLVAFGNGYIEAVGAAYGPVSPPVNTFGSGGGLIYA